MFKNPISIISLIDYALIPPILAVTKISTTKHCTCVQYNKERIKAVNNAPIVNRNRIDNVYFQFDKFIRYFLGE
jgi:hypothetical protein